MRRAIALTLAFVAVAGTAASAGTYDVVSCGAAASGENNAWTSANSAPASLSAAATCPPGTGAYDGLRVYDVLGSQNAPGGARAEWAFAAPPGTRIVRWRYQRYVGKDGTNSWHVYARLGDGTVLDTCTIPLGAPSCHVGAPGHGSAGTARDATGLDTGRLAIGIECVATNGSTCATGGLSIHRAWAALYASTVTLREEVAPTLGAATGPLTDPGWQSGVRSIAFSASDGVGIAETRVYVDGTLHSATPRPCDFTYAIPCSDVPEAAHEVDTTALREGTRTLVVAAVDAAGNERRSAATTLRVDNLPPAAWIAAPSGSTTSEQLFVSWGASDAGSGVASYSVDVAVDAGDFAPWLTDTDATGATYVAAPGHRYRFRVRATDATGKADEASSDELSVEAPPSRPPDDPPPQGDGATPPGDDAAGASAGRRDPGLVVRSARVRRGRLVVAGALAESATGRVSLVLRPLRARGTTVRRAASIRAGRFGASLPLSRATRRGARLVVRYGGDGAHLPAVAHLAIRLR